MLKKSHLTAFSRERKKLMKMKKTLSVLCSAAVLLTSVIGGNALFPSQTVKAEEQLAEKAGVAVPQNLRYEDGDIVWDEVEGAEGYYLRVYSDNFDENKGIYYENRIEMDRLLYEFGHSWSVGYLDFGEYSFEVRAVDSRYHMSEWSNPITAEYAPALDSVPVLRVDGDEVFWDKVEGAYQYNVRIYNADREIIHIRSGIENSYPFSYFSDLYESGNYFVSVQAMDQDYNVSQWTELAEVIYEKRVPEEKPRLDTPQNVRFDESGDNIIWDAVENAVHYTVNVTTKAVREDGTDYITYGGSAELSECSFNWKEQTIPFCDNVTYTFSVRALDFWSWGDYSPSEYSEEISVKYTMDMDESIKMPELKEDGNSIVWDGDENTSRFYFYLKANERFLERERRIYGSAEDRCEYKYDCPYGEYEVILYAVDKNNHYNKKSYTLTFGMKADDSVWIPEAFYKFDAFRWNYDAVRNPTEKFWVRVRNAEDGSLADMAGMKIYAGGTVNYVGVNTLPDGEYLVDVCAYIVDSTDGWKWKMGDWSNEVKITVHNGGTYDKNNEVSTEVVPEDTDVPEEDRVTTVTVNPETTLMGVDEKGNYYELDLSNITIQASEIYDEEGLKRAEEALGKALDGNTRYNLLDLTLLYNGQDFSNSYKGLVQVVISLPEGHLDDNFSIYRIVEDENGDPAKEEIPGERVGDTYVIYLEHFSLYALVGKSSHEHTYGEEWKSDEDGHWQVCTECEKDSEKAEHKYGEWKVTKEASETEEGSRERVCETCGYKQTEAIEKLTPANPEMPGDGKNPGTGAAAAGVSALVLSACGVAVAYTVKKRNKK